MLTSDEIQLWLGDPVTKEFMKRLARMRSRNEDLMAIQIENGVLHKAAIYRGAAQGLHAAITEPKAMRDEINHTEENEEDEASSIG